MRPGVNDEQQLANNLWFRQTDYVRKKGRLWSGETSRRNATSTEEDLEALALRRKPHGNPWPNLSPRLCTLGQDAFEHAPAVIKDFHQYLKAKLNAREEA